MASDYNKIAEEHEKRYGWDAKPRRIYKRLYSDKTHFVYELIQNADDSGSSYLKLQLDENGLLIWNDGRQFEEQDVRKICSLGSSDKDLTHIGTFGIGFKAVYNYTEFPEIYSDDESFRIQDFIKPEGIDEVTPEIAKLMNKGKTVFRLPFKGIPHQENDVEHLKNRLCNLSKERSLLFLRHLERVEWKDKRTSQTGSYSCHRHPFEEIQNVSENESVELVKLTVSPNGNNKLSETFLVFCKQTHPPTDVIDRLLEQAEDAEEQQRIQRSAGEPQPIEIAFKLQDDRITVMDDCVLFAYLPTQKKIGLKFLIQARYQTTPARDNIPKPSENPWNRWLVKETANYLPEVLEKLKEAGLLEPTFFNVLPLNEEVENDFKPIADASRMAMKEKHLVPTQDGGYAKAENVFYPHRESLRNLVECNWIYPNSSWLHPDIGLSGHAFNVMREAGVREIKVSQVLNWLEKRDLNWFEDRCEKWLRSLYVYLLRSLNNQISQLARINRLPLVRLENGKHVSAAAQSVFFAPDTDEAREEIESFLEDLPILQSSLLAGEERNEIEDFLENQLGVRPLSSENLIKDSICPLYRRLNKPPVMKNRWHVRYIFQSWQKTKEPERKRLEKSISNVPILRVYKGIQRESCDFVVPRSAYLPQAYTGDDDLETYFSVSNGDLWFVDDKYLTNKSNTEVWLQFLKAIGSMNMPPIHDIAVSGSKEECEDRGITYENSTKPFKDGEFKDMWYRRPYQYFDGHIIDASFYGLSEVLAQIGNHNKIGLPKALWGLLVKLVSALPSEEWQRSTFFREIFQGTYYWHHQTKRKKYFDAAFYCQLKDTPWLPDEQGNFHVPFKCFAPTNKNREVLGDSVPYLPADFNIRTQPARWLAKQLGVNLEADVEGVLGYLQILSKNEASIEQVKPIYEFLCSEDEHLWRFEEEPLIFTPEPEPRWWRTDEVFWEDESAVFGDDRGYLKAHYSEDLESFFTTSLEVPKRADTLDYVRGIQDIASKGQTETKGIRDRVQKLYRRLWQSLQEKEDLLENEEAEEEWMQVLEDTCWLGRKGEEWGFFSLQELVWKDDDYRSELFKNEIPFWTFGNDLLEFAKKLGVRGCYQDSNIEFDYNGDQEEDTNRSAEVRGLNQNIRDFLNSPHLCGEHEEEKSTQILNRLSVRRVEKLEVRFRLKGVSILDPNPRQSFLEEADQEATLWLASEANEDQYAWLIGDALQDYFGDVKELSAFVENLLTKDDKESVLARWQQKGLRKDICVPPPEENSEENEEDWAAPVDEKLPNESGDENANAAVDAPDVEPPINGKYDNSSANESDESETHLSSDKNDNSPVGEPRAEIPTANEMPEIDNGDPNSGEEEAESHTYTSSRTSSANRSGGHSISTSSSRSGGGHGGSGGGGEGEKHENLKRYLANNPSQFGKGLELVEIEYTFGSGDRVDILLKDGAENPVTVEVETGFSSGAGRYVGVWQAVKYQHLAAMKYGLPCEQVRSILAAPKIPEDVKEKCKELGIEPIEVVMPSEM